MTEDTGELADESRMMAILREMENQERPSLLWEDWFWKLNFRK